MSAHYHHCPSCGEKPEICEMDCTIEPDLYDEPTGRQFAPATPCSQCAKFDRDETIFINVQMVYQQGQRPLFTLNASVHAFDEHGISGQMPMIELTEYQDQMSQEAAQKLAGILIAVYREWKEKVQ